MRVTRAAATLTAAAAMALAMVLQALPAAAVAGMDSNYFGESAFVVISPGGTNQFAVGFTNTGSIGWTVGTSTQVNLGTCGGTQQTSTCTMNTAPLNSAWASTWLSAVAYTTTTTNFVGPGQIGWFTYTIKAPTGAAPGDYDFPGDVVLASTGEALRRQGYYQRATIQAVGAPAKLGCTASPNTITTGSTQTSTISVTVQDANGVTVSSSTDSITLSQAALSTNSWGSLDGNPIGASSTQSAVNGVATFKLTSVNTGSPLTAAGTDQLSAFDSTFPTLTGCAVNVTFARPGPPASLAASASPNQVPNQAGTTVITARLRDASGVTTTNPTSASPITVTFSVDNVSLCFFGTAPGASSTTATIAAGASSTTTTWNIQGTPGVCTFTVSATGLTSGTTTVSVIASGPASKIVVTSNNSPQPTTSNSASSTITVKAQMQDAAGNPAFAGSPYQITLNVPSSCSAGNAPGTPPTPPGGYPGQTDATVTTTFTIVDAVAETCTLTFTHTLSGPPPGAPPSPAATSASTSVTFTGSGPAAKLTGSFRPAAIPANGASTSTIQVCVADAAGNTVTSGTGSTDALSLVPASTTTGGFFTTLATPSPQTAVAGCASFTVRSVAKTGSSGMTAGTDTYTASDATRTLPTLSPTISTTFP